MVDVVEELLRNKSKTVTIEFRDGEVVDAILLEIDPDEHHDFTFDVLSVRSPSRGTKYNRKNVYVAQLDAVQRVTSAE